jgi:hypothetical protein
MNKGIAYIFIALLMFDALGSQALASPIRAKAKGVSLGKSNTIRQPNKHVAIPQILAKSKKGDNCGCGNSGSGNNSNSISTNHKQFSRCYQTIGTAKATIDQVVCSEATVDTVVSKEINVKTITTETAQFRFLTSTKTFQKFLRHVSETIWTITTVHRSFKTLVPISVTVDVLSTVSVEVGSITSHSAWIQTLTSSEKTIRVKTTYEQERRQVTSTEGVVDHVKLVHEEIEQSAARSVTGGSQGLKYQSRNGKSWSNSQSKGGCGCNESIKDSCN